VTPFSSFVVFARFFLALCWLSFLLLFLRRRKGAKTATDRHAPAARAGMALQGVSFALVWSLRPEMFPSATLPNQVRWVFCGLAMFLAVSSVWLVFEAVRVLGKQWSIEARLVKGHRLVVEGPYSHLRHPIYTGLLGMLLATGLVYGAWWGLAIAVAVYWAGTAIRVRAEERLLHEAFGDDFEAYRPHVPAIIPRWKT
jgi:protein-S-isoprenylcysteine O-methyltransferase Ste14